VLPVPRISARRLVPLAPVEECVEDLDRLGVGAGGDVRPLWFRRTGHQLVPEPPGLVLVGGEALLRGAVVDVITVPVGEPERLAILLAGASQSENPPVLVRGFGPRAAGGNSRVAVSRLPV